MGKRYKCAQKGNEVNCTFMTCKMFNKYHHCHELCYVDLPLIMPKKVGGGAVWIKCCVQSVILHLTFNKKMIWFSLGEVQIHYNMGAHYQNTRYPNMASNIPREIEYSSHSTMQ